MGARDYERAFKIPRGLLTQYANEGGEGDQEEPGHGDHAHGPGNPHCAEEDHRVGQDDADAV